MRITGVAANANGSKQHANGDSSTGVNTTVSATDKVTITAPGKTTINGGIVSGNQVTVDTGNLDITSPQDTSHYDSSSQAGLSVKAGSNWSAGGSYGNQNIKDHYQSTGKDLSGIYGGDGGVDIHVGDTTHLKAGVISSTADASKNHFDTGKLIAETQENQSKWDATATGGGLSVGTGALGSSLGPLGVIAGNLAQNSGLIAGGNRKHDETSTSQSAISGNINVNAGSTEGGYTTDVNNANGHLENKFNADKLANQLQNSQLGMQLVGEVMGQVSDALHNSGVKGFDETKLSNDWRRILLEATGSAAVGGVTGGNVGSAAASSAAGTATVAAKQGSLLPIMQ
ncbi:hemagglutinin repeat-containing protein [Commensalibacter nepenthis]|uniref:Hemagglutinin repeat-containing protein n=1 Tax=Commensalibacter nepenthis TaxID=3043872 RepID=A0ABT6Q497_9PROT|nr:hemagglutinin repeat-containing protein [Commensalibacter sp. TBRC 10068]MDI2111709.1 hemagglutinin repeat-containing protein [Commensalibacter sp. TBRC 10068]